MVFYKEIMIIVVVIVFLLFIGFREWMTYTHIRDLELKAFAKNPDEYVRLKGVDKPTKPQPKEEDDLVDPFEINAADALKGLERKA